MITTGLGIFWQRFARSSPLGAQASRLLISTQVEKVQYSELEKILALLAHNPTTSDRKLVLQQLVQYWHGPITSDDGMSEDWLNQFKIPAPLRWWYSWAGKRTSIMSGQNKLLFPNEYETEGKRTIFYYENQGVYEWATLLKGEDPPVFGRYNHETEWNDEGICLTEHLIFMCLFEAIMCHSPWGASISHLEDEKLAELVKAIPQIPIKGWRWFDEQSFHFKDGAFMCIARYECSNGIGNTVYIGAKERTSLQVLVPFIDDNWEHVAI